MERSTSLNFFTLLTGSYRRLLGKPLAPEGADARWLYEAATFPVLAHNSSADPRFLYANRAAQACFGYAWDEIVGMPSRLSAEASDRAERARLLDIVARNGYVTGYSGLRIAKSGHRFRVADGVVWQLVDEEGFERGQAATFRLAAD